MRFRVSTLTAILMWFTISITGCDFMSGLSGKGNKVTDAYVSYRRAISDGDITALKGLVAREKAAELEGSDTVEKIKLMRALYPAGVRITGMSVEERTATLVAQSTSGGVNMRGVIRLVREDGAWKVYEEKWEIAKAAAPIPAPVPSAPQVPRPANFYESHGVWKGREIAGNDGWTFTFGENHSIDARGPGGEWMTGRAAIYWHLGTEPDGSLRVPPGSTVMDVEISGSSNPGDAGKVSLGAYDKRGERLNLCVGAPGGKRRALEYKSLPGIRCFELDYSGGVGAAATTSISPAKQAVQQSASGSSGFSAKKEKDTATGEAEIVIDGVREVYPLKTGFMSDTRLKDPKRATVQFQAEAEEFSNARRVEITLDATKAGRHFIDGKAYSVFREDSVPIGESTPQGYTAIFKFIADGGQIFPPKDSCVVEITSPFTGKPEGVFAGELKDCTVHSAGIDKSISALGFRMVGVPSR